MEKYFYNYTQKILFEKKNLKKKLKKYNYKKFFKNNLNKNEKNNNFTKFFDNFFLF